jgi:hypothetical protein
LIDDRKFHGFTMVESVRSNVDIAWAGQTIP